MLFVLFVFLRFDEFCEAGLFRILYFFQNMYDVIVRILKPCFENLNNVFP